MTFRLSFSAIGIFWLSAVLNIAPENSLASAPKFETASLQQACPTISVSCPADIKDDEPIPFTASVVGGNPNVVPVYQWTISAGRIIAGQGSNSIRVDMKGFGGQSPTGTVNVGGFDSSCPATASCSILIEHWDLNPKKFDSYGALQGKEEFHRLNAFAVELQKHPGLQGYILVYGGRRGRAGEAQKLATSYQEYLVKTRSIERNRIVTVDAGFKERLTVDLWLVPPGTIRPVPEPTVDPSEVIIIKGGKRKVAKH